MQKKRGRRRVVDFGALIMTKTAVRCGWAALALLLCFCLALGRAQNSSIPIPQISSSVLVFGPSDYVQNGGQSRCQTIVQNALKFKQSELMFVPTGFWVDDDYALLTSVNSQSNVSTYCLNRIAGNGTTPNNCPEATQADVDLLTSSMAACFKTAVNAGLNIAISPHLDDGLGLGGWRNGLVFDPLEKYGQWSYVDFFLFPLADALSQTISSSTIVHFAMQGEMSATVMYYPESYIQLLSLLKDRVLTGNAASFKRSNIQIGVSTNFNKLCACVLQDLVDTYAYVDLFPAAFAPLKSQFNLTGISDLYNQTDFIGISSYPSLVPNFSVQQLEAATQEFDFEIGQFGVNLTHLNVQEGKPLFWNEYGIGGGSSQNGNVSATTAAEAAANPYFGIFGSYNRSTDPWVLYNLSEPSPVRDYLRYYYNQSVNYAEQTGTNKSFNYIVSGIYIWNGGSWDVQGLYPESTDSDGSYLDTVSATLIANHNAKVIAATTGTNVTTDVSAPSISATPSTGSGGGASTVLPSAASSTSSSVPGVQGPVTSFAGRRLRTA